MMRAPDEVGSFRSAEIGQGERERESDLDPKKGPLRSHFFGMNCSPILSFFFLELFGEQWQVKVEASNL